MLNPDLNAACLKIPKDIYLRILSKAVAQTQVDIRDLEAALPVNDMDKVQSISHRWKGDYDNMRVSVLSAIAKKLNEEVKTTRDKDNILALLGEFRAQFSLLESELSKLIKPS